MKFNIVWTIKFKKDYKMAMKRHMDMDLLDNIIRALSRGEKLPEKNKGQELTGASSPGKTFQINMKKAIVIRIPQ